MPNPKLTDAIERLARREDLSAEEASAVLGEVMAGNASEVETAAFLIGLRAKGETVDEIAGLARTMRNLSEKVEVAGDALVDTAGTGGGRPTFNVSTTAAFVAAAAGCRVAKHGNRSATSQCGSADVLEALGAEITLEPGAVAECIDEVGFGFMFAPRYHAAMKHVVPVRKQLGVRTIFNMLGPLTNPAGATRQVIGVSDGAFLKPMAAALCRLDCERALVVSSLDGLDELSVASANRVIELSGGDLSEYELRPEEVGVERFQDAAVAAGTPEQNAVVVREVLDGHRGAPRALAVLNAAAAIYVAGAADSLEAAVPMAEEAIDSGAARDVMERFVARSQELAPA